MPKPALPFASVVAVWLSVFPFGFVQVTLTVAPEEAAFLLSFTTTGPATATLPPLRLAVKLMAVLRSVCAVEDVTWIVVLALAVAPALSVTVSEATQLPALA